jgi:hypothetical protein
VTTRIIAEIEAADGGVATISVTGRVVTFAVPAGTTEVALRSGPAHARRLAEALLLAARVAEAGTP